jgi:hypothetical protein
MQHYTQYHYISQYWRDRDAEWQHSLLLSTHKPLHSLYAFAAFFLRGGSIVRTVISGDLGQLHRAV